jgi:hypothetical protein
MSPSTDYYLKSKMKSNGLEHLTLSDLFLQVGLTIHGKHSLSRKS